MDQPLQKLTYNVGLFPIDKFLLLIGISQKNMIELTFRPDYSSKDKVYKLNLDVSRFSALLYAITSIVKFREEFFKKHCQLNPNDCISSIVPYPKCKPFIMTFESKYDDKVTTNLLELGTRNYMGEKGERIYMSFRRNGEELATVHYFSLSAIVAFKENISDILFKDWYGVDIYDVSAYALYNTLQNTYQSILTPAPNYYPMVVQPKNSNYNNNSGGYKNHQRNDSTYNTNNNKTSYQDDVPF